MFMRVRRFDLPTKVFDSVSAFAGALVRAWERRNFSHQVEFPAVQEFPLDLFPRLQPNRRRQRDGEVNVEFWVLSFGPNGLHFQ